MITGLLIGLALGLFIGWLRLRQAHANLTTITEQSNKLREALGKATAQQVVLTARVNALSVLVEGPDN
jgi:hypothetical protein